MLACNPQLPLLKDLFSNLWHTCSTYCSVYIVCLFLVTQLMQAWSFCGTHSTRDSVDVSFNSVLTPVSLYRYVLYLQTYSCISFCSVLLSFRHCQGLRAINNDCGF